MLRAERREEHEVKEENWYRMERSSGSLYRRLPMPEGVQADQIQAALTDGVLEVTIPKPQEKEAAGPEDRDHGIQDRQVTVQASRTRASTEVHHGNHDS